MKLHTSRRHFVKRSAAFARRQDGNSLIETAFVLPVLLLLLAGAVDIGRAFRAAMIVNQAASTGAAYGIQNPSDTAGMQLAAKTDTSTLVTVVPAATYGCECPDGTSISCSPQASCPSLMNSVYYVEVDTTATYTPMLPWPGISSTIPLSAKVRLRASR